MFYCFSQSPVEYTGSNSGTFSENITSASLAGNLVLYQAENEVAGTVTLHKKVAVFIPERSLQYDTFYTVKILTGVTDSAGNALKEEYCWSFKTGLSDQSVTISVNAPAQVAPGTEFDVQIDVSEVNNLAACGFDLVFDESVIDLIEVGYAGNGVVGGKSLEISTAVSEGRIRVLGLVGDYPAASGTGYLAIIHFRAVGSAGESCDLNIEQVYSFYCYNDYLYDIDSVPIQCEAENGRVEIIAGDTE